jgi:hypothetical protein
MCPKRRQVKSCREGSVSQCGHYTLVERSAVFLGYKTVFPPQGPVTMWWRTDILHIYLPPWNRTLVVRLTSGRLTILLFIHQWLYSPLLGPGLFFSFVIFFYKVGTTPWTSDQLVVRPLPTHRTTQTQKKRTHRHPCLEWDSNSRSQHSS